MPIFRLCSRNEDTTMRKTEIILTRKVAAQKVHFLKMFVTYPTLFQRHWGLEDNNAG